MENNTPQPEKCKELYDKLKKACEDETIKQLLCNYCKATLRVEIQVAMLAVFNAGMIFKDGESGFIKQILVSNEFVKISITDLHIKGADNIITFSVQNPKIATAILNWAQNVFFKRIDSNKK